MRHTEIAAAAERTRRNLYGQYVRLSAEVEELKKAAAEKPKARRGAPKE